MGSKEPVQQKIDEAKLSLRTNAAQIDFFKPVKDNPLSSLGAAFLLGATSAESDDKRFSTKLLSTFLSLYAKF